MAFKQTPGRSPFLKTGRGIPSPLLGLTKAQRELKRSMKDLVRQGASQVEVVDGKATATKMGGSGKLDRFSRRGIRQYIKGKDMKNKINTRKDVVGENKVSTTPIYHEGNHKHPHDYDNNPAWTDWSKKEGSETMSITRGEQDGIKGTIITKGHKETRSAKEQMPDADWKKYLANETPPQREARKKREGRDVSSSEFKADLPKVNLKKVDLVPLDVKPVGLPDLQSIPKRVTGTPDTTPKKKDVVDLGRLEKKDKPPKIKKDRDKIKRDRQTKRDTNKLERQTKRDTNKLERQTNRQDRRQSQGKCPPCNC